jgi:tripartite-type tricarboxylate transporter receptor subunit TctC
VTLIPPRRAVVQSLAALPTLILGRSAVAQTAVSPLRPTRVIVPLPPGSSPDLAARLYAEALARRRGHPIAVENRVGATGAVAGSAFLQARPGDALFFGMGDLLTVAPLTDAGTPFADPEGFLPISTAATDFMVVSVPASLPVRSLPEFVDYARARPGALNWFATPGTALYIAFNAFLHRAGVDAVFVSFRNLMMQEVSQGRVHAALVPVAVALPFVQNGSVRLLATSSRTRAAVAPEVPTTAEAGFPDLWVEGFLGVFGWRGMPDAAREDLAAETRAVLTEPVLAERYAAAGLRARASTPQEFQTELDGHRVRWAALAREFGAMPKG